jgi:hypothetical protein
MHVKSGSEVSISSGAFHNSSTVATTRLRRSFLLHSGILMVEEPKTATEIARLIKERAYIQLGPWPVDLQLIIFSTTFGWRCGLSPATQTSGDARYRDAVLEIARELQSTVRLVDSEADKKDPPA